MRIIILIAISISLLSGCKRGQRSLEINDVKPIDIPASGGQDSNQNQQPYEWDGSSDLALSGLTISAK